MDLAKLKAELALAPYAGKTPEEAAALLKTARDVTTERTEVPAHEVFEAVVPSEYAALTSANKTLLQTILGMGTINVQGSNTRAALAGMFGAGTATRAALVALQTRTESMARWKEIGLAREVDFADVQEALRNG